MTNKVLSELQGELENNHMILPAFREICNATPHTIERMRLMVREGRVAHSGTTIVGFMYRHGVVMAADRQTSYGWHKSMETVKLKQVGDYSVIGMAGMCACMQEVERRLLALTKRFERLLEKEIHVGAQGRILERILKHNFLALGFLEEILGYIAVPILGGVDSEKKMARLYSFDGAGAITDLISTSCKYDSVGSGSMHAKTILDSEWKTDCSETEALYLAVKAIYAAGFRDMGSSPAHIAPPTVALITTNGVEFVPEVQTFEIANFLHSEHLKRRGVSGGVYVSIKPESARTEEA